MKQFLAKQNAGPSWKKDEDDAIVKDISAATSQNSASPPMRKGKPAKPLNAIELGALIGTKRGL